MATSIKKINTTKTKKKTATISAPQATKIKTRATTTKAIAAKVITQLERDAMVQQTAYFIAEKSNFQGDPHEHWVAAESQVKSNLASKNVRVLEVSGKAS